jgi:hypothetical protein
MVEVRLRFRLSVRVIGPGVDGCQTDKLLHYAAGVGVLTIQETTIGAWVLITPPVG